METKTSDKIFKVLTRLMIIIFGIALILFGIGKYLDNQTKEFEKQQAEATLPVIMERIDVMTEANPDIYMIETDFEYESINYVNLYVEDTWFNTEDVEKKRFASDVRDNVKSILLEEGFIKANDRVGIYVYSYDGISLAESKMNGEIKIIN